MRMHIVHDVSSLETSGFGANTLTWWGTLAFMSLEATGFALAGGAYLYLMARSPEWPLNARLPDYWPGSLVLVLFLISVPVNHALDRWARAKNLKKVQIGLIIMSIFGILPLIVRGFEFQALHVSWDTNAYGSAVWFLLALHTTHLLTDLGDTIVLTALMFTRHADNPRRFSDVSDNAFYWDFVVLTWIPIYALIYWIPRLT